MDELKKFMGSEENAAFFSAMALDVTQLSTLVSLIDVDGDGLISESEFIWRCHRLKGEAKSLEIATLKLEVNAVADMIEKLACELDEHLLHSEPGTPTISSAPLGSAKVL